LVIQRYLKKRGDKYVFVHILYKYSLDFRLDFAKNAVLFNKGLKLSSFNINGVYLKQLIRFKMAIFVVTKKGK